LRFFERICVIALICIGVTVSDPGWAQTRVPPPVAPAPVWEARTYNDPGNWPSPQEACQFQHDVYNPGATMQPATGGRGEYWECHWALNPNSNTILPALVKAGCPSGWGFANGACHRSDARDRRDCMCEREGASQSAPPAPVAGNPVSLAYGAKVDRETDYETADGRLSVERSYFSLAEDSSYFGLTPIPGFGARWHGVVPGRLISGGWNAEALQYMSPNGVRVDFKSVGNDPGYWIYNKQVADRRRISMVTVPSVDRPTFFWGQPAVVNGPAEVRMDMANGEYLLFRRSGSANPSGGVRYLVAIEHGYPDGYKINYDYPDDGEYPNLVRDSFGRQLQLTWTVADRTSLASLSDMRPYKVISQIIVPDGTKIIYGYGYGIDALGSRVHDRLESVSRTSATGTVLWSRSYLHENTAYSYGLTGKVDQLGRRLSTYSYDQAGLVSSTERAGGVDKYTIENLESVGDTYSYRYVTNPLGKREDYTFKIPKWPTDFSGMPQLLSRIDSHASANTPATTKQFAYDGWIGDYNLKGITNERGIYSDLQTDGQLRPLRTVEAQGTNVARTTDIQWDASRDLPTKTIKPGLTTDLTYEAGGRLKTRTETDTTTTSAPYSTNGQQRTWTYNWSSTGQITSIDGPKGLDANGKDDIDVFTYDTAGNLVSSTNALGHVTTLGGYDANGRPAYSKDPNDVYTRYTYDALGRVLTVKIEGPTTATDAITTMAYDVEGRVTELTLPSTQKLFIDYDLAGRPIATRAANGEKIALSYDAMSNVTSSVTKRADNTTARSIVSTFDELGRMLTQTLGPNRVHRLSYDENGNPKTLTGARSNTTTNSFDALDRLVSTVAPDTGSESIGLDAHDRMVGFTDAKSVSTTFVRNGFGEVIGETSPDRGAQINYYDAAGDLVASVDGRGQRVDLVRDALGRITKKTPVGRPASEIIQYGYDAVVIPGSYAIGRLISTIDSTGKTQFGYDQRGNITTKRRRVGTTLVADLVYAYDNADRVTGIQYPSGRVVQYVRDTAGRVITVTTKPSLTATRVTLVSNITYDPFGSILGATYANGLTLSQSWGNDGLLASKRLYHTATGTNVSLLTYGYDPDDNIISIADGVDPTRSVTFGYDSVGRLSQSVMASGSLRRQDFVHDLNGNRTRVEQRADPADTNPVSTATYTLNAGTNRLASVADASGTRSIAYDGRGNTIGETRPGGGITVAYDGYGRLTSYQVSGGVTLVNDYNGFDERITGGTTTDPRLYTYDADGRMLGEYGSSYSDVKAETIWLSPEVNTPQQPFGGDDGVGGYAPLAIVTGNGTIYWTHGNHLGVPIAITDGSGNLAAPSGYTPVGFPGQSRTLADLYYNRYRDYDSSTGRYIQADPVGLDGGQNNYVYAENNPINRVDPKGLNALALGLGLGELGGGTGAGGAALAGAIAFCSEPVGWVVCGGAAIYGGYKLYKWYNPDCPDQAPTTTEMAKGGKQNIDNEYVRDVQANPPPDICAYLRELYKNEQNPIERQKIKQAMKRFNCDNRGRFE
jgi:RHS repeat-associated protein